MELFLSIKTIDFTISTKGFNDIIDITENIISILNNQKFGEGNVLIFVPGATAGVTTIEYEPGLLKDYPAFMEKIVPQNQNYAHNNTWHDGNGFSHIRASLQGASLTVPFKSNTLLLGTWQQIVLIDFDNRPRIRKIVAQFHYE